MENKIISEYIEKKQLYLDFKIECESQMIKLLKDKDIKYHQINSRVKDDRALRH